MQLKVSLRQSTRARKANHNTSSMLFTAYVICAQVTHTACVWFAWERGMRRRLSRFALLLKGPLLQGGFLQKRFPWRRPRFHWKQRSWGSQRDLMEGSETSESLSPSSPVRSDDRSPRLEARQADTSPRAAAAAFLLSSSEEVDKGNAGQIAPSLSPQYEELVEVITPAVAKLNLDWLAERFIEPQETLAATRARARAVSLVAGRDKSAVLRSSVISSALNPTPSSTSLSRSAWYACNDVGRCYYQW